MSTCGPWQMAATSLPPLTASSTNRTVFMFVRILSGATPPGMMTASKSEARASVVVASASTETFMFLPVYFSLTREPSTVTSAPAAFNAAYGIWNSLSST
jgi:hypothetical protein